MGNVNTIPVSWEEISRFSAPQVVARYAKKSGVEPEVAAKHFRETLRFLYVCGASKCGAPSPVIDECWHNFILHTREYKEFCQRFFGRFLHHRPLDRGDGSIYRRTRQKAVELFGDLDGEIWPVGASAAGDCADCQLCGAPGDPCDDPPEQCQDDDGD